jgi:hypothetical protein
VGTYKFAGWQVFLLRAGAKTLIELDKLDASGFWYIGLPSCLGLVPYKSSMNPQPPELEKAFIVPSIQATMRGFQRASFLWEPFG